MFVMEIKLSHNPENKPRLKHTKKPQTNKYYKKCWFYRSLTTYFEVLSKYQLFDKQANKKQKYGRKEHFDYPL